MSSIASGLLKMLGNLVAPGTVGAGRAPSAPANGGADFAGLLQKAREGKISSERPVTISGSAEVTLTPDQLARVSIAADQAEAEGAVRALVLIDGKALKLDVSTREVTGETSLAGAGVLTNIDTVINVPGSGQGGPAGLPGALPLPAPGAGMGNASLLKLLSAQPAQAASAR
jgi:hypothetical protein